MTKAVLFDLDGTLLDTAPAFHLLLNEQLADVGREPISLDAVRTVVSEGAAAMVCLAFGIEQDDAMFAPQLERLLERYAADPGANTQLFPGMATVLDTLDELGIPWGVVTNKPERFTVPILAHLGLSGRVGTVICPDHVSERKPSPEGLLLAAQQLGVAPLSCCYIGDHKRDIEAGHNANMATIGVTFGYLAEGEDPYSWRADAYADRAEDILLRLGLAGTDSEDFGDESE